MTKHRFPVMAAAVLALAATSAAGCARQNDLQAMAAQPTSSASGADVLAGIIAQVYGTPAQREAGDQRGFYQLHAAWGACMVSKGADYQVPAYVSGGRSLVDPSPGDLLEPGSGLRLARRTREVRAWPRVDQDQNEQHRSSRPVRAAPARAKPIIKEQAVCPSRHFHACCSDCS